MKKVTLILLFVMGFLPAAPAQNIVLGERVPELKAAAWLDNRQPAPATITYVEFFHSSNPSCISSVKRLIQLFSAPGRDATIIVVTKEDPDRIAPLLRPLLSERLFVALHAERGFELFGVAYVPSGVLIGPRNRALWMGNSLQFNERLLDQALQ